MMTEATDHILIFPEESRLPASLGSGPCGQNVNKVTSRMTLWFDVVNSPSLLPEDKELIMSRLATRIGKDGVLRVISQQTLSQPQNKELAMYRFAELLQEALRQAPIRKKARVSRAAKLRRLEEKKQRGSIKSRRSEKAPIED